MKITTFAHRTRRREDAGQVMLFMVLGLGIFLIGAMAFAIDLSNMWFNRQSAQTAADAACTAAAMDMLVGATNGSMPSGANFSAASANTYDCKSSSPLPAPCSYAALNGYSSSISQSSANSGTLGDNVYMDFPSASSVGLSSLNLPPSSVAAAPLVRVKIIDNIPTWFAGMLKGMTKQSTGAQAICGVIQATSPIPILVLNPTVSQSFHVQGTPNIVIVGGPSKSIQVNSVSATATSFGGASANVNLCAGGGGFCGSTMGVWGPLTNSSVPSGTQFYSSTATCTANRPAGAPSCSTTQTAPQFNYPSAPIADPLASQVAPSLPTTTQAGPYTTAAAGAQGCPLTSGTCDVYGPGYYPNGIQIKNRTAIFDPGIYYMAGNPCGGSTNSSFCAQANSCIRPSTNVGDGSGGTVFYFADTNGYSVQVGANAGCSGTNPFNTTTGTGSLANGVKCTSSSQIPSNLPGTLAGSVLLAPCQKPTVAALCASANGNANCNLNFGDPLGTSDPFGEQRGVLLFQDRAVNAGTNPSWDGGGSSLLAGTIYLHQCVTSGSDTGQGCVSGAYNDLVSLGGNSGSTTYVLGDIIVDQLLLHGTSGITMDLNPSAAYTTLKAALVQ
jgi:hypothetical protein